MPDKSVIVIGGGHAGVQFVISLRQEGFTGKVTLVSADQDLPYHKPPLSKSFLKKPDEAPQWLRAESFYRSNDIELHLNTPVASIDREHRQVVLQSGETLSWDALVLATGGEPRRLSIPGVPDDKVRVLRSLADATALRDLMPSADAVVIIGGGFIGLEVATTLAEQGHKVSVIEATPRILGRAVAPAVSDYVAGRLQKLGVHIVCDCVVEAGEKQHDAYALRLSNRETVSARLVLAGIGMVVNDSLAADVGLECDNGICVDQVMRTSDDDIFAIGDCTRFHHWLAQRNVRLESVQNASDQARTAAAAIVGKDKPYLAVPWFWSELAGVRLQMVGLSFDADEYLVTGDPGADSFSVYHFAGDRLVAIDSVNKAMDHMLGRKFFANGYLPGKDDVRRGEQHLKEQFKRFTSSS